MKKKPSLTLILNGRKANKTLIKSMIHGLNDKNIRTEKGGYLLKAALDERNFYLGIIPEFNQGERSYHYNIELTGGGEYFLTGSLNPDGFFSVFFIPKTTELSFTDKHTYARLYQEFANYLLSHGLNKPGPLDQVSRMLLKSSGLFKGDPQSLFDLTLLDI